MIRVVIVDDHAIVRAGVRAILQTKGDVIIAAEADNGRTALEAVARHRPDVLVIDLTMPELNGMEVVGRVRALSPHTKVLVLSMHAGAEFVRPALRAGALGYVVKGTGLDDLVTAIRAVAAGERFLDAAATAATLDEDFLPDAADELERLTPREREVLQLVAEGFSNREIGERLGVTPKTIDVHRTSLMKKLDLHNAAALTRFAIRRGLITHE
ncbi:MAG TPA: response regulator transcription factor [Polyangia bacterium]|jgi:RNA polymerase sigma factor (sigma-70 family)|nr:response regulator transcription factor [Polyangia bacterium]